ncbi:MAG: hypothetical protein KBA26_00575 [Candidatus Delongbacteria bacterium]|nr:hypothetical protein [Candidatus Delongbacteria bacterium]
MVLAIIVGMTCAKMAPPPGGPEDKTPPTLLSSIPNEQTPLHQTELILEFSERLDPISVAGSIRIFPPGNPFKTRIKANRIHIDFTQKPDYAFYINLSDKISDLHSNRLPNPIMLAYGDSSLIPDGTIQGTLFPVMRITDPDQIKLALLKSVVSGEQIKDSVIWIHRWNKADPRFLFRFLDPDQFYDLIAFQDNNSNNLPDPDENLSVFHHSLQPSPIPISVSLFQPRDSISLQQITPKSDSILQFSFTQPIHQLTPPIPRMVLLDNRIYWFLDSLNPRLDSLSIRLEGVSDRHQPFRIDTLFQPSPGDTVSIPRQLLHPIPDRLANGDTLNLLFNFPVIAHRQDLVTMIIEQDTLEPELIMIEPHYLQCPIRTDAKSIKLIVHLSRIDTVLNDSHHQISIIDPQSLSTLSGHLITPPPPDLKLCLISLPDHTPLFYKGDFINSEFTWHGIPPGQYLLMTFVDHNRNRRIDYGAITRDSLIRGEPYHIQSDTLLLRAYWENEGIRITPPE